MTRRHRISSRSPRSRPSAGQQRKAGRKNLPWLWIGLGTVIIATVAALFLLRPQSTLPADISVAQAYEKFQQGALFIDVRDRSEWNQLHIPRSTPIPLNQLQNHVSELPRDHDIVLVCQSGRRSKEGVTMLQQAGFSQVSCVTGGLQAWSAAGYPTESTAP